MVEPIEFIGCYRKDVNIFLNKLYDIKALKVLRQMNLERNPNYTEKCAKRRKRFWPVLYGPPVRSFLQKIPYFIVDNSLPFDPEIAIINGLLLERCNS